MGAFFGASTLTALFSQAWAASGRAPLAVSAFCMSAITGAGAVASRLVVTGLASIWRAWLRVMPVTANNTMPTRQMAALIQCHRTVSRKNPALA